jgi:hypothetical protein
LKILNFCDFIYIVCQEVVQKMIPPAGLGAGLQEQASNHLKAAVVKSYGGER